MFTIKIPSFPGSFLSFHEPTDYSPMLHFSSFKFWPKCWSWNDLERNTNQPTNQPSKLQVALRKCSFKQTAEKILLSAAAAIHLPENWIQGITSFPAWNDISFLTWIFCFWERFWVRSHLAPAEPDLKFPLWSSTGTTKPLSPTSSFQEPAPKSLSFTSKKLDCNVKQILNVPHSYFHSLTSYF